MRPPIQRKRRTREHVIADLSVNHVERIVLKCGWVTYRMTPDYGIDLVISTFAATGEVENGEINVQLKATDSLSLTRQRTIPVTLDSRDLLYWLNEPMPVILIVFDARQERAYWLHLQPALRLIGKGDQTWPFGTIRVHVPAANRLHEKAVHHFRDLRNAAIARLGAP